MPFKEYIIILLISPLLIDFILPINVYSVLCYYRKVALNILVYLFDIRGAVSIE